jgi:DNA polymerase-3 subunit epsilon
MPSLAQAATLAASNIAGPFELSTYRILQGHLARGLRVMPLGVPATAAAQEPVGAEGVA